jgi:hypothetical protein
MRIHCNTIAYVSGGSATLELQDTLVVCKGKRFGIINTALTACHRSCSALTGGPCMRDAHCCDLLRQVLPCMCLLN